MRTLEALASPIQARAIALLQPPCDRPCTRLHPQQEDPIKSQIFPRNTELHLSSWIGLGRAIAP
ncbi:hypothetical protein [Altericista sp. CCNU0014]|uniref:hypothetical protein n=1 Tax=Altericista sp. CCNU0014 TaxID=3082949 RepID=UPI00384D4752